MNAMRFRKLLVGALIFTLSGCAAMENNPKTFKGAGYGAAGGAATGAAIGAILGGGKGAGKGAAIGAVVGLLGGGLVGNYLDRQEKEMQKILGEQDRLRREQDRLQVGLSSDVLFSSGSAELFPGGRQKLDQVAGVLNRYPESTVQIIGHTDNRGSEDLNMELSRKRAHAVASELAAVGVNPQRISILGRGASMPIATNATPEGRAQNRRVDIIVIPLQQQGGSPQQPVGGGGIEPR